MSDRPLPAANEQRRHQRIGFDEALPISIGHHGERSVGSLENLSLGGLMFRSKLQLSVGEIVGCEFCVFDSPLIDIVATVASKVGEGLYGVRFHAGPMSQHLIEDAISSAIRKGKATIISIHNVNGSKIMRVAGGLTAANSNDFMHAVARVGVAEIDLSEVTLIDKEGVALCTLAVTRYGVNAARRSSCVQAAWNHP
ncbi:MAG: hypothetical protein QG592_1956 [Pseudomonadota bacterium]|nr:hypothetical protein [Pseudomonadota bacterium]